jgi:hypothetical protein
MKNSVVNSFEFCVAARRIKGQRRPLIKFLPGRWALSRA